MKIALIISIYLLTEFAPAHSIAHATPKDNNYTITIRSSVPACLEMIEEEAMGQIVKLNRYQTDKVDVYTKEADFSCVRIESPFNLTKLTAVVKPGSSETLTNRILSQAKSSFDVYNNASLKKESVATNPVQGADYGARSDSISQMMNLTSRPVEDTDPPSNGPVDANPPSNGPVADTQTVANANPPSNGSATGGQVAVGAIISPQTVFSNYVNNDEKLLVDAALSGGYVMGVKCPGYETILPLLHDFGHPNMRTAVQEMINGTVAADVDKALARGLSRSVILRGAESDYMQAHKNAQEMLTTGLRQAISTTTNYTSVHQVKQGVADGSLRIDDKSMGGAYLLGFVAYEVLALKMKVVVDYLKCNQ